MTWVSPICCICARPTWSPLIQREIPLSLRQLLESSKTSRRTAIPVFRLPRMSTRASSIHLQQNSPKRRRIEQPSPRVMQPYGTMALKHESNSVQLELTEVESRLRQLLLDVAAFIDDTPPEKSVTGVQVPEQLAKEKVALRWTGGWVRDKLLQVESHDIDVAINNMTGEHFGLQMQAYLEIPGNAEKHNLIEKSNKLGASDKTKKIAPGLHKIEANPEKSKNLETATTKIMGLDLDLVNLRKETYNELSRNPQMEFGTAEEDAMRRDATVNAMFYNLHTSQVEDLTGKGFQDMAAKIIRTPMEPYQTFKDDPLRVLRLVRFASRLDYTIEPETAKAMANPEIQDVLRIKISRERVGVELEKMLKGPRPHMALELIDRFGLYGTVFTDPTRKLPAEPDTASFQKAYDLVESVIKGNSEIPAVMVDTLLRNEDEKYLAWVCATTIPWVDAPTVPNAKSTQRPYHAAYLVAREGFKAPNKVCDVIAASLDHIEEIRSLIGQCARGLGRPDKVNPSHDATARDILGMAIRRWGSTWRTQVFFNFVYETVQNLERQKDIVRSYATFLNHVTKLKILDVDTFRPLLKGTELAQALGTKPGPWMKDALDVVMAWQLRNPDATDPAEAIEAVKLSRHEKNDSELPSCLASQFLELTIPPLFPQNKSSTNALEASRQPAPWKDAANQSTLGLLRWSTQALGRKEIEARWRFLVPPILRMVDDIDIEWKTKGCDLLGVLLEGLRSSPVTDVSTGKTAISSDPSSFLQRTGYHNVLAETLFPLFAYVPSLTPEADSAKLFDKVLHAVLILASILPSGTSKGSDREAFLDKILRTGIVSPLAYFPTPASYPELATTIMSHLQILLGHMGIESVKHVQNLIPLFSGILAEPFALAHQGLLMSTLKAQQVMMLNAWPRLPGHRGEIMMGLCLLWGRCVEVEKTSGEREVGTLKEEVKETVGILDAVMQAVDEDGFSELWDREKQDVGQAATGFGELFGNCRKP